jgi:hypothetical protein
VCTYTPTCSTKFQSFLVSVALIYRSKQNLKFILQFLTAKANIYYAKCCYFLLTNSGPSHYGPRETLCSWYVRNTILRICINLGNLWFDRSLVHNCGTDCVWYWSRIMNTCWTQIFLFGKGSWLCSPFHVSVNKEVCDATLVCSYFYIPTKL